MLANHRALMIAVVCLFVEERSARNWGGGGEGDAHENE